MQENTDMVRSLEMFYREEIWAHPLHTPSIHPLAWPPTIPHQEQEGGQERGTHSRATTTPDSKYMDPPTNLSWNAFWFRILILNNLQQYNIKQN